VQRPSLTHVLLVRAAGRACALPLGSVVETMRPLAIQVLAGAPFYIDGVALVRGMPTPVIDLGVLLGGTKQPPQRFVHLRLGERAVALAVDEILGVRALDSSNGGLPPLLRGVADETLSSLETLDEQLLWVLRDSVTLPETAWPAP
jgi:purine-binding chemotaxis protein CheW